MKKHIILFAFLSCIYFANAQNPKWKIYLPGYIIYSIAIDTLNNKWIGSDAFDGIQKFDDINWTHYNIPNYSADIVYLITIDKNGDKWCAILDESDGAYDGLAKFDSTLNWTIYNPANSGLPDYNIMSIAVDGSGNKWVGTEHKGLAKFDGTNWIVYDTVNSGLPNDKVTSISIDKNGVKWIGTYGGGMAKFDGINWAIYNTSNSNITSNIISSIACDNNGVTWVGTWGSGLAKFDGTNWTVYDTINSGLPDNNVNNLTIDNSGNIWAGTYNKGLIKYDGINWTVYNISNSGLTCNDVYCINIDKKKNLWIGTNGFLIGGLIEFNENGIIGNCSAQFLLYPDTTIQHHYWALNNASGVPPLKYLWSWGDGSTDTIAYPSHIYSNAGFYDICLTITDSVGCTSIYCDSSYYIQKGTNTVITIDVINPLTVGLNEIKENELISVFPNPFTNSTTLQTSKPLQSASLIIYNILGEEVKRMENLNGKEFIIRREGMSEGMYFYRLVDKKGIVGSGKMVVE